MELRGPGGVSRRDFQCCPPIVKKRSATQHGSPSYSAKFTLLSQKQRRYAYDSDVYAKIFFNDLSVKIMGIILFVL